MDPCQCGRPGDSDGCPGQQGPAANRATFLLMTSTGIHGSAGPGQSFGLFVWKLHSGELVFMVLDVSGREKERNPVRSHPLVLQTHKDMRGRKSGRRRQSGGDARHFSRGQCSAHQDQELLHTSKGSSPLSRHERIKEKSVTINTAAPLNYALQVLLV